MDSQGSGWGGRLGQADPEPPSGEGEGKASTGADWLEGAAEDDHPVTLSRLLRLAQEGP